MPASPNAQSPRIARAWAIVFLLALALFSATAATTIQWQDYGHFALRIVEGQFFNEYGLALIHPLHYWLCQLADAVLPVETTHAVALISALAGAITIANVFGCVISLTRRLDAAVLAAVALALANTFWRMSTMPECYTVTTALLSAELWCLALFFLRSADQRAAWGWLVAAVGFNGLGWTNHNLALLTAPILGVVVLRAFVIQRRQIARFGLACLVWVLGASAYLTLIAIESVETGDAVGAIRSALFGNRFAGEVLNTGLPLKLIAVSAAFTVLSFANLTLPLMLVGVWCALRDKARLSLGLAWLAALVIHLLFVVRYNVVDQYTFLLPVYTIAALFAGVGYAHLVADWPARRARAFFAGSFVLVLLAPAIYVGAASAARLFAVLGDDERNKPYRDDYQYLFVPWGVGETSAKQMAEHAIALAGPGGVVLVDDGMARFALKYTAITQGDEALAVIHITKNNPVDWQAIQGRSVVLVPAGVDDEPIAPPAGYQWEQDEPMYRLVADTPGDHDGAGR